MLKISLVKQLREILQSGNLTQEDLNYLSAVVSNEEKEVANIKNKVDKTREVNKNKLTELTVKINNKVEKISKQKSKRDDYGSVMLLLIFAGLGSLSMSGFFYIISQLAMFIVLGIGGAFTLLSIPFGIKTRSLEKKLEKLESELEGLQKDRISLINKTNKEKTSEEKYYNTKVNNIVKNIMEEDYPNDKFYIVEDEDDNVNEI